MQPIQERKEAVENGNEENKAPITSNQRRKIHFQKATGFDVLKWERKENMGCDFNEEILVDRMEENPRDIDKNTPLGGKGNKQMNVHVQNIEDNEVDGDPMQYRRQKQRIGLPRNLQKIRVES